jgi:hypothetical protein
MTSGIQAGVVTAITKVLDRTMRTGIRWLLVALLAPCAMAQTPEEDRRREYNRQQDQQREEQQRRAQEEYQRQLRATEDARKRDQESRDETTKSIEDHSKRRSQAASGGQSSPDRRAEGPKLPAERNVLLGSWRVDSGGQGGGAGLGQGNGTDRNAMARELLTTFTNPCVLMFGKGITFAPSTYSIEAIDGSVFRGSVEYSSPQKQVILAITQQSWKTLPFEIEGPNRIVWGRFGCALARVGAPAANAAAKAVTAPGNPRAAAAPAAGMAPQVAAAANATNAKLAVGPDAGGYLCPDGRQLYVKSCYDESSDSRCGVVNMHLPPRNDFQVVTTEIRSEVLSRVAACKILPLQFTNGTVSLAMPKSATR